MPWLGDEGALYPVLVTNHRGGATHFYILKPAFGYGMGRGALPPPARSVDRPHRWHTLYVVGHSRTQALGRLPGGLQVRDLWELYPSGKWSSHKYVFHSAFRATRVNSVNM